MLSFVAFPKDDKSGQKNSEASGIKFTTIHSDYPTESLTEQYAQKKEPNTGVKFLSNGKTIHALLTQADLKEDLKTWNAYQVDQLLLRTYFVDFERAKELYPSVNVQKLKKLKQALVEYENK